MKKKLLIDVRCQKCQAIMKVPAMGIYRVECDTCGYLNVAMSMITPPKKGVTLIPPTPPAKRQEKAPIKAPQPPPNPEPVPEAASDPKPLSGSESTGEPLPEWNKKMLKAELLEIALEAGLDVSSSNTKAQIVSALEEYGG